MALYKVLADSFINLKLCKPGDVVDINDDPKKGGMRPGSNLVACEVEGKAPAKKAKTAIDVNDIA